MEITVALALSILGTVISVSSFVLTRKDKSNQNTEKDSYKWGSIDEKLSNIDKTLIKIENKLDTYDKEIEEKIKTAMQHHINEYHKNI